MAVAELTEQSTADEVKDYAEQVVKDVEAERKGDAQIASEHADNEHKPEGANKTVAKSDETADDKGEKAGEESWLDEGLKAEAAAIGLEESELDDFTSREELERALRLFDKKALEAGRKALAEGGEVMSDILVAEGVGKKFGGFVALKDVSVSFARDKLSAIIGPNGAGKSTFFNVISGAFPASSGRVTFEGRDITALPTHEYARRGIAKSFQITNVFPQLSAHENVRVAAQMQKTRYNLWTPRARIRELIAQADDLLERVGIAAKRNSVARDMAHGEQRCLEIAMALACQPRLLLLDEPTAGMSPEETVRMMDLIVRLAAERTVILVEHKMKLVMGICQQLVVLHHGELLAQGSPDDIRANDEVKRVYLGQGKH